VLLMAQPILPRRSRQARPGLTSKGIPLAGRPRGRRQSGPP
jgi:hypothetical protein